MRYLSLFDGIGAAHVAWRELGWKCVGVSEIEAFPIAVTQYHYPDVPHLGDVTKITEEQIAALGPIDLVIGGFPCTDLSVAGKRAGLRNADGSLTRSGLFFDAMRVVRWARERCGCRFLLIENVPGLYSSNGGRDFAAVVGEMVGAEFGVPPDGWRNTGAAAGPDGLCEWATLDAQWFHLAQRRVRVFALADFGDWASRPPILFERSSLQGNPPPRREARQGVARGAAGGAGAGCSSGLTPQTVGALTDGAHNGGGSTARTPTPGASLPSLAMCLNAGAMGRQDAESETLIPTIGGGFDVAQPFSIMPMNSGRDYKARPTDIAQPIMAGGPVGGNQGGDVVVQPVAYRVHGEHSTAMTGSGIARVADPVEISRCLDSSGGYAANQGGNVVVQPVAFNNTGAGWWDDAGDTAATRRAESNRAITESTLVAAPVGIFQDSEFGVKQYDTAGSLRAGRIPEHQMVLEPAIAFSAKDYGGDAGEIAPTLRAMPHDGSHANGGGQVAVALHPTQDPISSEEVCHALGTGSSEGCATAAVAYDDRNQACNAQTHHTLRSEGVGSRVSDAVMCSMQVRRLTCEEAESLQGFPRFYTRIPWRNKPAEDCPDGPRYRALGNSMAVPVITWIGRRVESVLAAQEEAA